MSNDDEGAAVDDDDDDEQNDVVGRERRFISSRIDFELFLSLRVF